MQEDTNFSKVSSLLNLYSKLSSKLTFDNLDEWVLMLLKLVHVRQLKFLKNQLAAKSSMLNDCRADF